MGRAWAMVSLAVALGCAGGSGSMRALSAATSPRAKQQSIKSRRVAIIESRSFNSAHDMDTRWLEVANAAGFDATILPQETLDSLASLAEHQVLIVSSGVIDLPPQRRAVVAAFAANRAVYLQGEYLPTYMTNIAFSEIVNGNGGQFTWGASLSEMQNPTTVHGRLAAGPQPAPTLTGYWWAAAGSGTGVETIHTAPTGEAIGWSFCVPGGGLVITSTDQDFIITHPPNTLEHMHNVLAYLADEQRCAR